MNEARAAALHEERENVVAAVQRGESVKVVARTHDVPVRTVFNWRFVN